MELENDPACVSVVLSQPFNQGPPPDLRDETSRSQESSPGAQSLIIPYHIPICAMVKSRYIGDGHPTFNRESL